MPTPGLSLIGFMDRDPALNFLQNSCVPQVGASHLDLEAEWNAAKARLGGPINLAGHPGTLELSAQDQAHVTALSQAPWFANAFQGQQITFCLVEVDPLIAYQFHVDTDRSHHHCDPLGNTPSVAQMLPICLPITPPSENIQVLQSPQSVVIRSKNLSFGARAQGMLNQEIAGMHFNLSLPYLHVVRFNGRSYLHNGFHRAYGLRKAGATHVPCMIRDVSTAAEAGIRIDGTTFAQTVLESNNPPTVGHFTNDRAHAVRLRRTARILHVSWAEYVMPEE